MQILPNQPAFLTIAFALNRTVDIQQIQRRDVLQHDDGTLEEFKMHPTELLFVANPTPQDITGDLAAALGEVNAALLAELVAIKEERDRLRIIVDAFPTTDSAPADPAIAAEPGLDS